MEPLKSVQLSAVNGRELKWRGGLNKLVFCTIFTVFVLINWQKLRKTLSVALVFSDINLNCVSIAVLVVKWDLQRRTINPDSVSLPCTFAQFFLLFFCTFVTAFICSICWCWKHVNNGENSHKIRSSLAWTLTHEIAFVAWLSFIHSTCIRSHFPLFSHRIQSLRCRRHWAITAQPLFYQHFDWKVLSLTELQWMYHVSLSFESTVVRIAMDWVLLIGNALHSFRIFLLLPTFRRKS